MSFSTLSYITTDRKTPEMGKVKKGSKPLSEVPSKVQTGTHGRYQIKSGSLSGEYVARAFPQPPSITRGLIAEAKGATEEAALTALRDIIDAREKSRIENRRVEPVAGFTVPSAEEYGEALNQVALSQPQRAMLIALAHAEETGLTESRLASVAGYKSGISANRALASAGVLIANYLCPEGATDDTLSLQNGMSFLGHRDEQHGSQGHGSWVAYHELREAVRM